MQKFILLAVLLPADAREHEHERRPRPHPLDGAYAQLFAGQSVEQAAPGVEAVFQLPRSPIGTLFLAHGCSHAATDFWPRSAGCPACIGLPEEVRITRAALEARLAVVALSSADRRSRCWSMDQDGPRVASALTAWRASHGLAALPLGALGASSGGAFVLLLPRLLKLDAIVSQIMAVPPRMLPLAQMPPALFVHMPRDARTAALVNKCVRELRGERAGAAAELAARAIEVAPQKVSAGFFAARVDGLSHSAALTLHGALQSAGLLDPHGLLLEDPRRSAWREAIGVSAGLGALLPGPSEGVPDSLVSDESAVSEVLNVAWAMHEIVSEPIQDMFAFVAQAFAASGAGGSPRWPPPATEL